MKDNNINTFYYKLLNIREDNSNIDDKITNCINEVIPDIKKTNANLSRVCKVIANNLSVSLHENNIENIIINLSNYGLYEHEFIVCRKIVDNKLNYYLLDPSFIQFKGTYPFLNLEKKDNKLLDNLVNKSYSQISNESFQNYLEAFNYKDKKIDINNLFIEKIRKIK